MVSRKMKSDFMIVSMNEHTIPLISSVLSVLLEIKIVFSFNFFFCDYTRLKNIENKKMNGYI